MHPILLYSLTIHLRPLQDSLVCVCVCVSENNMLTIFAADPVFCQHGSPTMQQLQETEADEDNEEDLTVTHRKHLRFFGVRWRYWRMSIAVFISICFAVAGIMLHDKQKTLVSLFTYIACGVHVTKKCFLRSISICLHFAT